LPFYNSDKILVKKHKHEDYTAEGLPRTNKGLIRKIIEESDISKFPHCDLCGQRVRDFKCEECGWTDNWDIERRK